MTISNRFDHGGFCTFSSALQASQLGAAACPASVNLIFHLHACAFWNSDVKEPRFYLIRPVPPPSSNS